MEAGDEKGFCESSGSGDRVWKPRNFEEAKSLGYGHRWGVGKELLRAIPGLC